MIAALLLALSLPVRAESPNAAVARVMAKAEKLVAAENGKDASEIADHDRQAENLSKELKPFGWRAAPALGAAAQDLKRPAKVRLFATSFLALIRDPAALPPLEDILLNPEQAPFVRALAAQSLPGQGAADAAVRAALCKALAQTDLPREVLSETLIAASRLGCPEPGSLARIARSFGARPSEKDMPLVAAAIATLGHSRGADSGKALLALIAYFSPLGAPRASAIAALDSRRAEIANWLAPEALPVVTEALRTESDRWDTMIPLIHLASALGPEAAPALSRLSRHPDAEVLAEAAEALVPFKHSEALPALESVIAGAMNDPRFSPKEGRPDPAVSLARLEKAVAALRRAR
jgi:hypothetical protein